MPIKEIVRITIISLGVGYAAVGLVLLLILMPFPTMGS